PLKRRPRDGDAPRGAQRSGCRCGARMEPVPKQFRAYLRRRLRGRVLQLQGGGGPRGRCIRGVPGKPCLRSQDRQPLPGHHPHTRGQPRCARGFHRVSRPSSRCPCIAQTARNPCNRRTGRMISRASLGLLALGLAARVVYGEPVYVIEQLVVGVSSAPGAEGERIGQVKSADKLELLERQGEEAHVQLPNGRDGWIKAAYLSTEEPLQVRLTERTAEIAKLKQESEKLKQDVKRLESDLSTVRALAATTAAPPAQPAPIRETVFLRSADRPGQTTWSYLLGVSFVMLLVGFVIGWKTLDRRIRQKYGGLRIYLRKQPRSPPPAPPPPAAHPPP